MNNEKLREVVADRLQATHGNPQFIQEIREGKHNGNPWVQGATFVRDWFINELTEPPEIVEEIAE